jgi:hypothetical protein
MADENPYQSPSIPAEPTVSGLATWLVVFAWMLLAVPTGLGVFLFAFFGQIALLGKELVGLCFLLAAIAGVAATLSMWRQGIRMLRGEG